MVSFHRTIHSLFKSLGIMVVVSVDATVFLLSCLCVARVQFLHLISLLSFCHKE